MDRKRITLITEDVAQENIIQGLIERLIVEHGFNLDNYEILPLSVRGGGSIGAFKEFIKQSKRFKISADALIVGSDANCHGFQYRKKQLAAASQNISYPTIITAVPDPHIERWYLLDAEALSKASNLVVRPIPPTCKCDKNHYKSILKRVFEEQGIFPPLRGAEYGKLIAKEMDLYNAGKIDHGFNDFIDQMHAWLKQN